MSSSTSGSEHTAWRTSQPDNGRSMVVVFTMEDNQIVDTKFTMCRRTAVSDETSMTTWAEGNCLDDVSTVMDGRGLPGSEQVPLEGEDCPDSTIGAHEDVVARVAPYEPLQQPGKSGLFSGTFHFTVLQRVLDASCVARDRD